MRVFFKMFCITFVIVITSVFVLTTPSFGDISKSERDILKRAIAKYRKSNLVEIDLKKSSLTKLLNKETSHEGSLFFSGGLVRFETQNSEKVLVIFDGKFLWNVSEPIEKDSKAKPTISKGKVDPKNRQQLIVTELLTKESLFTHFNLSEAKLDDGFLSIVATPKKDDWNLTKLKLRISIKENLVKGIDYWDDVENETRLEFKEQRFLKNKKLSLFKYTPPKGAVVNEL